MRRDPPGPLSYCSTIVLNFFPSGVEEAMPLGCEDCWFDELGCKASSVVYTRGWEGKWLHVTIAGVSSLVK